MLLPSNADWVKLLMFLNLLMPKLQSRARGIAPMVMGLR
jgi:hypothetical protein